MAKRKNKGTSFNSRKSIKLSKRAQNSNPSTVDSQINKSTAKILYVLLVHTVILLISIPVLSTSVLIANAGSFVLAFLLIGLIYIPLTFYYPFGILKLITIKLGISKSIGKNLPYYAMLLTFLTGICQVALIQTIEGMYWMDKQKILQVDSPMHLPEDKKEGLYQIKESKISSSTRLLHSERRISSRASGSRTNSTTWYVAALAESHMEENTIRASARAGNHCTWVGYIDDIIDVTLDLNIEHNGRYFRERNSSNTDRYRQAIQDFYGFEKLPDCTRILERVVEPESAIKHYVQLSVWALIIFQVLPLLGLLISSFINLVKSNYKYQKTNE